MSQAEENKSVIVGVCYYDLVRIIDAWETVKALFEDYFNAVVEAIGSVNESLEITPGVIEPCLIMEAEDIFRKIDKHMALKKNHIAHWKSVTKLLPYYNYIPVAIRNMPYQRRAY